MLTRADIENLLTAVFEATDLAAEGRIADGYEALLLGRSKALEGEANFEPSAEAVEAAWDSAIRRPVRRRPRTTLEARQEDLHSTGNRSKGKIRCKPLLPGLHCCSLSDGSVPRARRGSRSW